MAAITLARAGAAPLLIDRDAEAGDALCGGFLSWNSTAMLRRIGLDPAALGGHRVTRLALYAGSHRAEVALPAAGYGLSRRTLDEALRHAAMESGARLAIDRARQIGPGLVVGEAREWQGDALLLATGKHDIRGCARPRPARDPALGLRLRVRPDEASRKELTSAIELHLFTGGYAGVVLQEDGRANLCLAVRKSLLARAGGNPQALLRRLAARHPAFARRLRDASDGAPIIDSIGAVPYGFLAEEGEAGLFRLGDQAAVIPSLAGEGMGLALASGLLAARHYASGGGSAAPAFRLEFARRARRPLQVAGLLWQLAERPAGARAMIAATRAAPPLAQWAMRLSRI